MKYSLRNKLKKADFIVQKLNNGPVLVFFNFLV